MIIGVIGGSGLYNIEGLQLVDEIKMETPYGDPSDTFKKCQAGENIVYFMARHGQGHKYLPHELNHHANIWAMKKLGVECILSLSSVGSLKEQYHPQDFVLIEQYVDNTRRPGHSFFGEGAIAHVSMANPACIALSKKIFDDTRQLFQDISIHIAGSYVNIEGPAFSTKFESQIYRSWGVDVIGMTNFLEAKLAREAEICYLTIAMVTDYDCWHPHHDAVTVEQLLGNLQHNSERARKLLRTILPTLHYECTTGCQHALESALMSPVHSIPEETLEKLEPILSKYR